MGIFDFLKKKKPVEIQKEKIFFNKIEDYTRRKTFENQDKEKEVFVMIKDKIDEFVNVVEEKIKILETVDISEKKEQEKVKSVVNDSRDSYIESVESLMEKLESTPRTSLERFAKDINKVFFNFNKISHKNYERATILIGKEMAGLRDELRVFSRDLVKIFDENKSLIDSQKTLESIDSKLNQIKQKDKKIIEIDEVLSSIDKQIIQKQKQNKKILYDIEQIKESSQYLENIKTKEKVKELVEGNEKEIFNLKQFIDFKALAKFFHINPEQMQVVKEYREDFVLNFKKDNGAGILKLLDEIGMNGETILEKVKEINDRDEKIKSLKQKITKDPTIDLYSEQNKISSEIEDLEKQKTIKEDKRQRLDSETIENIDFIVDELSKINVEVVEDQSPSQATPSESPSK